MVWGSHAINSRQEHQAWCRDGACSEAGFAGAATAAQVSACSICMHYFTYIAESVYGYALHWRAATPDKWV